MVPQMLNAPPPLPFPSHRKSIFSQNTSIRPSIFSIFLADNRLILIQKGARSDQAKPRPTPPARMSESHFSPQNALFRDVNFFFPKSTYSILVVIVILIP